MKTFLPFLLSAFSLLATDYDVLITNARIADGTGAPLVEGSIAIKNQRIVAVGDIKGTATTVMDAKQQVVAPGFIDVHTHSEDIASKPMAENFVRMGVTTIITGNCGNSRTDVGAFFKELDGKGITINVATLIGHGSVREEGMGGRFIRAPNAEQLNVMKGLVEQAMKDGAVGLSTGLIYVPGSFAKTDEIVALARVIAAHGGIYASHMRHETAKIFGAMDELITIAREAKVRAELSHIKLSSPAAWGKTADVLAKLDKARAEGLEITHDQYVYTASSTRLGQLIPDAALEGTPEDFAKRLDDPAQKRKIIEGMREILQRGNRTEYSYAVIASCPSDRSLAGKTVPQAAKLKRGNDSLEDQIELILQVQRDGGASAIFHGIHEDDLRVFLQHPLTMIASDGGPKDLRDAVTHPRSFGNNARVLGQYVRVLKLLTLEEAIRKMTSLPAQTFRLKDRGVLKPGAWADVVVFNPDTVADKSTFDDPIHFSEGFSQVLVRGVPVLRDGEMTGQTPGGSLKFEP